MPGRVSASWIGTQAYVTVEYVLRDWYQNWLAYIQMCRQRTETRTGGFGKHHGGGGLSPKTSRLPEAGESY